MQYQDNETGQASTDLKISTLISILYFIGFATGISAVAGLIVAYMKNGQVDHVTQTHLAYHIRTFWYGFATLVVGTILTYVLIGVLVLGWWVIWTLVRTIKAFLAANEGRAIDNPFTLMW